MDVNSLPKTVTRQRHGCDMNQGPSAPESSTLTIRLTSHPVWRGIRNKLYYSRQSPSGVCRKYAFTHCARWCSLKTFLKSVDIWQSYKQQRMVVSTPTVGVQSVRDHVLSCNLAKYSPILNFFTSRLSNNPFLIWLLSLIHI